jgi:lipoprotein Spr
MTPGQKIFPLYLVITCMLISSCGSLRSVPSPTSSGTSGKAETSPFLEGISVNTSKKDKARADAEPDFQDNYATKVGFNSAFTIDRAMPVQFRYSILMNTEVESISNTELYNFIDNWWGTPYRMGGMTQRGVDCSAFVQNMGAAIFDIALPRTAKQQYDACHHISVNEATEGDLIFFNTKGGVSHVGVYLQNNKFVHASTSGGVMISDLSEPYWAKRFIMAGRPDKSLAIGQ